jgi:hypothetical protein
MNQHYESEIAAVTRRLTESHLSSMRASAIGGASVSTAIILLLLQTGVIGAALKLALYASSLAVPAWIAAWQFIEAYSFYGRDSYRHFNSVQGSGLAVGLAVIGIGCLATSLSSMIWHLAPVAAVVFIVASVSAAILIFRHNFAVRAVADSAS